MEVCGARVMMDAPSSVQKRIRDECTDAKYFAHCSSHIAINLVIVNRCNAIPEAENTMNVLTKLTWFLYGVRQIKNENLDFHVYVRKRRCIT